MWFNQQLEVVPVPKLACHPIPNTCPLFGPFQAFQQTPLFWPKGYFQPRVLLRCLSVGHSTPTNGFGHTGHVDGPYPKFCQPVGFNVLTIPIGACLVSTVGRSKSLKIHHEKVGFA